MKQGLKTALVVLGLVVAAAPFWVALTIPFEKFEVPPTASFPRPASATEILADLVRWDAAKTQERRAAAEDVARRLPDFALLRLETFSCGGQTHEVAVYSHAKTGMEFALVPGGTFLMGSQSDETDSLYGMPSHVVTLTSPFLIARTDCTRETYAAFGDAMELPSLELAERLPVETTWTAAKAFCDKTGTALPTEAQWERACRAGTTTRWCFGDQEKLLGEFAWYAHNSTEHSNPVGLKKSNAMGLYDVHGDVWQWCEDWPHGEPPGQTAPDPTRSGRDAWFSRVLRGGSCRDAAAATGSAVRFWFTYGDRPVFDRAGFRPAKTVPSE